MPCVIAGVAVYAVLTLIGWAVIEANRPPTCPKGHTDHYCLDRWRCRICAVATMRRGLRKLARERKP